MDAARYLQRAPYKTSTRRYTRLTGQARARHSSCPQRVPDLTSWPNPVSGPRFLRGQLTLYKEGILSPEINQSLRLTNIKTVSTIHDESFYDSGKLVIFIFVKQIRPVGVLKDSARSAHQGANFESHMFNELFQLLNIKTTSTSRYHLQCDGQVEQMNRTLIELLALNVANSTEN